MDAETVQSIKIYGIGCGVFFLIIILMLSWDTVEPTEWGLKYNSITKNIDGGSIYDSGRYFVFLFNSFITFPRTLKTIEFSNRIEANSGPLKTRTAEGLALELYISFQYKLVKGELSDLYSLANVDYEATFVRIARDTILQVAGIFKAPKYWEERQLIGEEMKRQLDIELRKAHATCQHLQVMQIELPDTYDDSIVQTQVEVQNSKMKRFEQEAAIIRQEIDILSSQTNQEINYIKATAEADSYLLKRTANAKATENTINAETAQYKILKETLSLNDTQLNSFVFLTGLMNSGGNLFVGFTNNMFVNQNVK